QRGLPGISRTLLSQRLRRLQADGLVERRAGASGREEYWLTPLGRDLQPAVMALGEWAARNYSGEPRRDELDPSVLMLWIERNVRAESLPPEGLVARFEFRGARRPRPWLVVENGTPSACLDDPGLDVDLVVTSDMRTLHLVFSGRQGLAAALRAGSIELDGAAVQRRGFMRWFGFSPFAPAARAALAG
ncbi:MAG: helix-turn-helix transcriptional regulator, partial [Chloroflexota bacterium]|nr:helix-turn-helix transcriptional regulator [Chloroflexota bacterium]